MSKRKRTKGSRSSFTAPVFVALAVILGLGIVGFYLVSQGGTAPPVPGGDTLPQAGPISALHEMGPLVEPTPPPPGTPLPDIDIPMAEYDFGVVPPTGVQTQTFEVYNRGEGDLMVVNFFTTCGCTTATLSQGIIPPGGSATLTVFFDVGFHDVRGQYVERGVVMETNDPDEPLSVVWIYATVAQE